MAQVRKSAFIEYSEILDSLGILYKANGDYLQSTTIPIESGWILHISIVEPQIKDAIHVLSPMMRMEDVWWKIVKNSGAAKKILDGEVDQESIGKVLTFYVRNENLLPVSDMLKKSTESFCGPFVPTDAYLGGCVFTRYGGFVAQVGIDSAGNSFNIRKNDKGEWEKDMISIPFELEIDHKWPFSTDIKRYEKLVIPEGYDLERILSDNAKGCVLLLNKQLKDGRIEKAVQKEGKRHMWFDEQGRDMTDRIKSQLKANELIADSCRVPRIIENYQEFGNEYLLIEFVEGVSLKDWILEIHRGGLAWSDIDVQKRKKTWQILYQIISQIRNLHSIGFIHRDISPDNFQIDRNEAVWIIDFEVQNAQIENAALNFKLGKDGFTSKNLSAGNIATKEDDYYALGITILYTITGIHPTDIPLEKEEAIENILSLSGAIPIESTLIKELISGTATSGVERILRISEDIQQLYFDTKDVNKVSTGLSGTSLEYSEDRIKKLIQDGLNALTTDIYSIKNKVWQYHSNVTKNLLGTRARFYDGVSSTLHFIGIAEAYGYNIKSTNENTLSGRDFLIRRLNENKLKDSPGLLTGIAGYLVGIISLPNHFINQETEDLIQRMISNEEPLNGDISLQSGLSGIGIAMINAMKKGRSEANRHIVDITNRLNRFTYSDIFNSAKIGNFSDTLSCFNGITGVLLYQSYVEKYLPSPYSRAMLKVISKEWIIVLEDFIENYYTIEEDSNYSRQNEMLYWSIYVGIKLYEIFGDQQFINTTENALKKIPHRIISSNLSYENGLCILGHNYINMWQITKDKEYWERAEWILNIIICLSRREKGLPYWSKLNYPPSPDILNGSCGVLLFLMNFFRKESSDLFVHI